MTNPYETVDVFGKRFQRELEQLKKESMKWQQAAPSPMPSPLPSPQGEVPPELSNTTTVGSNPAPHMDISPEKGESSGSGLQVPNADTVKSRNNTTGSLPLQQ